MKRISSWLALVGLFLVSKSSAVSLNDIQFWTGTGTNRAALVIEWSAPESTYGSTVPTPIADKSLVWGYCFNGTVSAEQMFIAVMAADPRLYSVVSIHPVYGLGLYGIGYHLGGGDGTGITDGTNINYFTKGLLTNATVDPDSAAPVNTNDLFWSGWYGPSWELWTEQGDAGGFLNCPVRGIGDFWIPDNANNPDSLGVHGQWEFNWGISSRQLTNGSWIGLTVAAGEFEYDTVSPYFVHKHAPALPDPSITALVKNLTGNLQSGRWQAQFLSCTNWLYALDRSSDLKHWTTVSNGIPGNNARLNLADPEPPAAQAFYRIRADQP